MNQTSVEKYLANLTDLCPEPPRTVSWYEIVQLVYGQPNSKGTTIVGMLLLLGIVLVWAMEKVPQVTASLIGLIVLAFFSFCVAGLPLLFAWRGFFASKYGIVGEAQVLAFERMSPGGTIIPPESRRGVIKGRWRVQTALRPFEQNFKTEATWADDITRGSRLKIVAHPKKARVLFVTRVIDASDTK